MCDVSFGFQVTPYYQRGDVTLYFGKAEDVLPLLPDSVADVGIHDPPYSDVVHKKSMAGGRSKESAPQIDGRGRSLACSYARRADLGFECLSPELRLFLGQESARLTRRWTLVFCDAEGSQGWRQDLVLGGLEYIRTGAWVKLASTPQFTGDRPAPGFETIVIAHPTGRKRWNGGGTHAVWSVPIVQNGSTDGARLHTTQKPEELMSKLVTLFSDPGETVIDFTAGSGTTLLTSIRAGRKAIGVEMSEKYCEVIAKRLDREMDQGSLFTPTVRPKKQKEAELFAKVDK